MTSTYQENRENGHHTSEEGKQENLANNLNLIANNSNEELLENNSTERQFKLLRQQFSGIAYEMQQTTDMEKLLEVTTLAVKKKLDCDRVTIYRFNSPASGTVLAEAIAIKWTPTNGETLPATFYGLAASEEYLDAVAFNNVNEVEQTPYQKQLLEKFQIQAYLTVPIVVNSQVWGLLSANSCSQPRRWQEVEIALLSQIAIELTYRLQDLEWQKKQQQQAQIQKTIAKVAEKILQVASTDKIFQTTTQEVRQLLRCDRVAVYCFKPDWSGEFVAESVASGWTRLVGPNIKTVWEDTHLQETQGGRYRNKENFVVNDIYQAGHADCHVDILEQFEIKAYVIVPVFVGQKLWGLLAAYQNSGCREWQAWEVSLLNQVSTQFGLAVSQAEYLEKERQKNQQLVLIAEQEKSLTKIINRIRQSTNLDTIFRTTTQEIRQVMQCDRVVIYRFHPDWSGEFIAESVGQSWTPLMEKEFDGDVLKEVVDCNVKQLGMGKKVRDTYLQETQGGRYSEKEFYVVNDVSQAGFSVCYLELLQLFEAKAYITVPIFKNDRLWGLMAAYQNSSPRQWQESEVSLMNRISVQIGVAISQAEYIEQTQAQSEKLARTAERQQNLIGLTRKIGEALTEKLTDSFQFDSILQITVSEVRRLLQSDRTVIYRFNPDWSGDFLAESVAKGWVPFKEENFDQAQLRDNGNCESFRSLAEIYKAKDTYLQDNKGGRYQQKNTFVVNDIYKAGFSACYIELLEQFEARAYLTVPIFKQNKLWGLLANYQNSAPREWEQFEVTAMQQIAVLLGVAMQQAQTVEQLQKQSQEVAKTAERERAVAKVIGTIRQSLEIDTIFSNTTKEVRLLLGADRVAVYRFNADWSGIFVAESVAAGWSPLGERQGKNQRLRENISDCNEMRNLFASTQDQKGKEFADTYLQETEGGELRNRKNYVRADIYKAGFTPCYLDVLEQYECKAYAIVPIFQGQKIWGMLAAYQNSGPREWQEAEVNLLGQIADQLGVALLQSEFLQQLQAQSARVTEAAAREKAAKEYLQKGAMQLLSAVRPALNGDLTVRAPITEDELGTIADAYNNTLQALRQIVIQVQAASEQVAQTSTNSDAALAGLTNLAQQQSREINAALREIQEMVDSTQAVVSNAELVQVAVQQANQTVETGDVAMNRTVEAIQGIRETVAQTSKKIKRLSESSQKISKVVNLISNFATQTNVLALNAAIEATRAGEYGKGFAVVADEVRSLSRQSAAATIEIEKLVQEIQEETGEVAIAMETGIQQVVEGTGLVSETRQNLNAIVAATAEISKLLQQITEANQAQMLQSVSVTASMKDVAKIASKTSAEANKISVVFQQLSDTAQQLLASVSKFKVN